MGASDLVEGGRKISLRLQHLLAVAPNHRNSNLPWFQVAMVPSLEFSGLEFSDLGGACR